MTFCFVKAVSEEVDDSLNDQWHMCELINLIVQPGKGGCDWKEQGTGKGPGGMWGDRKPVGGLENGHL